MRIPSGVTDQYIYFVAVDSADLKTRETGLTSFTVYRSRNGAAAALMTATVNETDSTNMPGVYELLLDEDMTIGSGNDSEEMVFHITQASMAPVTRTIELYRPKITAGNTLGVAADGDVSGNVDGNVVGSVASVTGAVGSVTAATTVGTINANAINAAAIATDAITNAKIATDAIGAAELATDAVNEIADAVWNEDIADHVAVGTFGKALYLNAYAGPVGPGVYIDDGAANVATIAGEDGTEGKPVSTMTAARTIADALGIKRYYITGTAAALDVSATTEDWHFYGLNDPTANIINLNSADVDRSLFENLTLQGVQAGAARVTAINCILRDDPGAGATTLHIHAIRCGLESADPGILLSNNDDHIFDACYSMVAGNGTPMLDAQSGANVAINIRHYSGGIELKGLSGTSSTSVETDGQVIFNATNTTTAPVSIRGNCTITDNATMTAITDDARFDTAQINAEADAAIETYGLDHLIANPLPTSWAADVASGTVFDQIADDGTAAYDRTTDSLQAIADSGGGGPTAAQIADAVWDEAQADHTTAATFGVIATEIADILVDTAEIGVAGAGLTAIPGTSLTQMLSVSPLIPQAIDLANTATYRLALSLVNSLDDLPSTAEITPGTIDIHRKAKGGTSWTAVVTAGACSETAGQVYYDEVFDSGTGYAEGDMLRITFKSISITADANTYEVTDATGLMFYTGILSATPDVNVAQISGDATAADNLQADYDGTGYTKTNSTVGTVTAVTNAVTVGTINANTITGTSIAASALDGKGDWNVGKTGYSISGTKTTLDALNDVSAADVNAQCDSAIETYGLDHLIANPLPTSWVADVASGSVFDQLADDGTATYDRTTDSLQAVRDNQIATTGTGLTSIPWNSAWDTEVQSEVNTALVALGLDHLISASVGGADVVDNSIIAKMVSSSAPADWATFVNTTDSLQAIKDSQGTSDGSSFTAIPWNAAWDAEVESEANEALVAFFTSAAQLVDDIWDEDIVAAHNTADTAGAILNNILPEKNAAFSNIEFLFVAASDHVTPVTAASGTGVTRSIDGGAFGAGTGTLAEVGNGIYQYDASAADMNGTVITFRFTGTGGTPGAPDDAFVTIKTSG